MPNSRSGLAWGPQRPMPGTFQDCTGGHLLMSMEWSIVESGEGHQVVYVGWALSGLVQVGAEDR